MGLCRLHLSSHTITLISAQRVVEPGPTQAPSESRAKRPLAEVAGRGRPTVPIISNRGEDAWEPLQGLAAPVQRRDAAMGEPLAFRC